MFVPPSEEGEEIQEGDPVVLDRILEPDCTDPDATECREVAQTYRCETRNVSFYQTPEDYAMFAPPEFIQPGAFIQGKPFREERGRLDPLPIQDRAMVKVTIPECLYAGSSTTVAPDDVDRARGAIISGGIAAGTTCVTPNTAYTESTFTDERDIALKAKLSAKFFGFETNAEGSYDLDVNEKAVQITYVERLYTIEVAAPQTPKEWFSDAFTAERLQEQVDLQRIGPDNLPLYVASVTYGRLLSFTMVSKASTERIKASISATFGSDFTSSVSADLKSVIENAEYRVAAAGFSVNVDALKQGNWKAFIKDNVGTAQNASPISFRLRSLKDNRVVADQELTEYTVEQCEESLSAGETFLFVDEQSFTPGFEGSRSQAQLVTTGDFNGDDRTDFVVAATSPSARGEMRILISDAANDGRFLPLIEANHSAAHNRIGRMALVAGDVDDDGRDDIIIDIDGDTHAAFITFFNADGAPTPIYSAEQTILGHSSASPLRLYAAQFDGARGDDLVWNNLPTTVDLVNELIVARAVDMTDLDLTRNQLFEQEILRHPLTDVWGVPKTVHVADFNGDQRQDIMWQRVDAAGAGYWLALGTADGFDFGQGRSNFSDGPSGNLTNYTGVAGDVNGDGLTDIVITGNREPFDRLRMIFQAGKPTANYTEPATNLAYTDPAFESLMLLLEDPAPARAPNVALQDIIEGDGRADLVYNDLGGRKPLENRITVGRGRIEGEFSFTRELQRHPWRRDWTGAETHYGDFDGDRKQDVAWVVTGAETRIYVALSRGTL